METEKLYSPLNFYLRDKEAAAEGQYDNIDYWRDPITHEEAFAYKDAIDLAILRDIGSIDAERGLAEYVPDSLADIVVSLRPAIELHGDRLWCVADVTLSRPITPGEMGELTQWWSGQLSDGWGEGLEQREIVVESGDLNIEPWTPDDSFFIATQKEFDRMMGNALDCRNGELRPGDLVLSTADNDYSCLVGTVLSITAANSAAYDAGKVHVNFLDAGYSKQRFGELEDMLGEMYGRPTTPGVLPPVDIEDVVMAPDALYRITGIDPEELAAILDSGENAAAYAQKLEAGLHETPAQAALHEPDIYDDEGTAALREQLIARLDANLTEYFEREINPGKNSITGMSSEIAAVTGAHYYLTELHNFHASELKYLLQFQNPLSVVADAFEVSGMDDRSDIMWDVFDRQDALQAGYALAPDLSSEDARKRELFRRLDSNLSDYCEGLMSADKEEIIGMAGEIAAQYAARNYLKSGYDFQPGEVDYLLQFEHPLALIANQWPDTLDGLVPMEGVVCDILADREAHAGYLAANARTEPAAQESPAGKPSVMEQIRQAREEAKGNPAPHRDTPGKDRGPEL